MPILKKLRGKKRKYSEKLKNGNTNDKDKKSNKKKPYDWDPTIRMMEKERRKSGIYIT